jgi:hypothetical protein
MVDSSPRKLEKIARVLGYIQTMDSFTQSLCFARMAICVRSVSVRVYATYMYTWTFLVQQNVASVVCMGAFCLLASKQ